jgi:hypothetical protein
LTPLARVLDAIVRRTLLGRLGYREGLPRMQLWVVHHLISQTLFDIWDMMLCDMEDTLAEDFKGHRQLPYAHWICFIIRSACDLPTDIRAEITDTTTAFPEYDIRQLWASVTREQAPRLGHDRGQRFLRQQLSRMRPLRILLRPSLQILILSQLIQFRMMPLTALTRITSPFSGTTLLGLMTMRPVVQDQPPAQTQPWWLFLRG